ncbi:MAG: ribosome silencing factor [Solirubrobacterales bacterium]
MGMTSQELTEKIAGFIDGKLGEEIVALDMRELVTYTDFLVIATARNERMADAIAEEIHVRLKKEDSLLPVNPDRSGDVGWTVMDYLDTVVHIFTAEARERFDLEELWHEAPRIDLDLDPAPSQSTTAA